MNGTGGHSNLAQLYEKVGMKDTALEVLNKGVAENPGDAVLYNDIGDLYADRWFSNQRVDDCHRAIDMFSNAIRFDPDGDHLVGISRAVNRST